MRGEKYTETSVSFHNRKVVYSLFFYYTSRCNLVSEGQENKLVSLFNTFTALTFYIFI